MAIFNRILKKVPKRQSEPKKRVTFNEEDVVDQVEVFENREDIWFSQTENGDFHERDMKMAMLLRIMDPTEVEIRIGDSTRGLEHQIGHCGKAMIHRRTCSVAAVMATQRLFDGLGKDGQDSIARAYGSITDQAVLSALARAATDQKFVADHVRVSEFENRTFEKRDVRPSVMGRQAARRSLEIESE